jgi:hypothetical protein
MQVPTPSEGRSSLAATLPSSLSKLWPCQEGKARGGACSASGLAHLVSQGLAAAPLKQDLLYAAGAGHTEAL